MTKETKPDLDSVFFGATSSSSSSSSSSSAPVKMVRAEGISPAERQKLRADKVKLLSQLGTGIQDELDFSKEVLAYEGIKFSDIRKASAGFMRSRGKTLLEALDTLNIGRRIRPFVFPECYMDDTEWQMVCYKVIMDEEIELGDIPSFIGTNGGRADQDSFVTRANRLRAKYTKEVKTPLKLKTYDRPERRATSPKPVLSAEVISARKTS